MAAGFGVQRELHELAGRLRARDLAGGRIGRGVHGQLTPGFDNRWRAGGARSTWAACDTRRGRRTLETRHRARAQLDAVTAVTRLDESAPVDDGNTGATHHGGPQRIEDGAFRGDDAGAAGAGGLTTTWERRAARAAATPDERRQERDTAATCERDGRTARVVDADGAKAGLRTGHTDDRAQRNLDDAYPWHRCAPEAAAC